MAPPKVCSFIFYFDELLGIQILEDLPTATFPQHIPPTPISSTILKDLETLVDHLPQKYKDWWNEWLADRPLPTTILPEGENKFFFF